MSRTCLKCGHVRAESDAGTEAECPRCGAIYVKVEAAMAGRAAASTLSERSPNRSTPRLSTRLFVLCVVAGGLIAYAVYANNQRRLGAEIKTTEQAAQRAAKEAADAKARQQQREAAVEMRAREEAERRAAMSPIQVRQEGIKGQLNLWDGSHNAAEAAIKARMHNPDSYKHVKTAYSDNGIGRGLTVQTTFRGTNSFGAIVTNVAVAEIDDSGRVLSLEMLNIR